MEIDDKNPLRQEIYDYNEYVKENIETVNSFCDILVEQILFYKHVINSEYDSSDLMSGTVNGNLSEIMNRLEIVQKDSALINDLIEYMEKEDVELKWRDFESMGLSKEFKREFKIYNLTKK